MKDDDKRRREIEKNIEEADRELERLEEEEEEREERRQLMLEGDDMRVAASLDSRKLMEDKEKDKKADFFINERPDGYSRTEQKSQSGKTASSATGSQAATGVSGRGARRATGMKVKPGHPELFSTSPLGLIKEAFIRRYESGLRYKEKTEGSVTTDNVYRRMWANKKIADMAQNRMLEDLKRLESTSKDRVNRMKDLNRLKTHDAMTADEAEELKRLQDTEVHRYWLREKTLLGVPLKEQENLTWIQPIGDGAVNVKPYSFLSRYALLSNKERVILRWYFDNYLLRWQHFMVGRFLPKKSDLAWFKKSVKSAAEAQFEDLDEEIVIDKKFAEKVKKQEAELDDLEEELTGYDRFTVEEEKKIEEIYKREIEAQEKLDEEQEMYA